MKQLWLLLASGTAPALSVFAGDPSGYDSAPGQLILTQMVSAPFPHPQRADGHHYNGQFYAAEDHYSDSTVAIFIPRGFRETGRIDFVVHFHGWQNNVTNVLQKYRLIEQLAASGRNVVLVVPQGPRNASDSFGGKLEDPGGFKRFMEEVGRILSKGPLKKRDFGIGRIVLSGHSGGYHVMSTILDHGGLASHVQEVWLFDALYGQTDKFLAWLEQYHGRLLDIYTEHGGTREETERLIAQLRQRGTTLYADTETDVKQADLRAGGPVFLFSSLEHDEVVEKHGTFRTFLETSQFEKIRNE